MAELPLLPLILNARWYLGHVHANKLTLEPIMAATAITTVQHMLHPSPLPKYSMGALIHGV